MLRTKSIAFKFTVLFAGSAALIFLGIIGSNYRFSKRAISEKIEENARVLAGQTAARIETVLASVSTIPEQLAYSLQEDEFSPQQLEDLLRMVVGNNPELYGGGIAFEPYAYDPQRLYYAPYYYRQAGELKLEYLGEATYRYFYLDWYQLPRELKRPAWTEPYFDDVLMVTYSVPFYRQAPGGELQLRGIICADISLEWLSRLLSSIKILKTGYAFLVSQSGTIITHPTEKLILNETLFSVAEERGDVRLREIGKRMVRGEAGFSEFVSLVHNRKCWLYYCPIAGTGWSVAVVFPEEEFLADIRAHNRTVLFFAFAGVLLLAGAIAALTSHQTRPLRAIAAAAAVIGKGNLDAALPRVRSGDEVGQLAESFARMQSSLKEYIRKLTETTAAKERIEGELKVAREIQASLLPRIFPAFPERREFDIFATMEPAKEVGGDFYDFFLVDQKTLCVVMGDVSGKGVPAALFMMIVKILLKNEALSAAGADEILTRVNAIVARDDQSAMFATVFCGLLDISSGTVTFANAGHNPPLLCRARQDPSFLEVNKGFVLGPMEGVRYVSGTLVLSAGDTLLLYTDGVTEAMNVRQEQFGEERLKDALRAAKDKPVTEQLAFLRQQVRSFVQEEPQSDDITMLALRFFGKK